MSDKKKGLSKAERKKKKFAYMSQFQGYLEEYSKMLIVQADNVASSQMQSIRKALRGKAVVNMGKNTLMKRAMTDYKEDVDKKFNNQANAEKIWPLYDLLKGNVGVVFTNSSLSEIRDIIDQNKVGAPARQGAISPVKVVVPAGNTGMEPTKTSFFQALNIPTKITRGTVEIIADHQLLEVDQKVGNSEAVLLQMLNIMPFSYGLKIEQVYEDGSFYSPAILSIKEEDILEKFSQGVANVASLSLEVGLPNEASIPHSIANSFKNLLAIAVGTEYSFKEAEDVKAFLADPSKFAVAAPTPSASSSSKPVEKEPVKEESEEEEDIGFGGLF
jgi:large subunit ribosomal protein LP0